MDLVDTLVIGVILELGSWYIVLIVFLDMSEEKKLTSDFEFSPRFAEVGKTEKNVFGGGEMFFKVFPTEVTWGKTQNQRSTFFLKKRVREKN